jgi:hypothetical protein
MTFSNAIEQKNVTRIFPIDVEAVELVLDQKVDDAVYKNLPTLRRCRHLGKRLAPLVPTADGQATMLLNSFPLSLTLRRK